MASGTGPSVRWAFMPAAVRSGFAFLVSFLTAFVLGPVVVMLGRRLPEARSIDRIMRAWSRTSLIAGGCKVSVRGADRLGPGPYLLVANHASNMDIPVVLAALDLPLRFLATGGLYRLPFVGAFMRSLGMIEPAHRGRPAGRPGLVEQVRGVLGRGHSLVVFPEGGRSRTGELLPFYKGAFTLAVALGTPIVPVGVRGTFAAWPPGSRVVRPGPIEVVVGEPIPVTGRPDIGKLRDATRDAVAALLAS